MKTASDVAFEDQDRGGQVHSAWYQSRSRHDDDGVAELSRMAQEGARAAHRGQADVSTLWLQMKGDVARKAKGRAPSTDVGQMAGTGRKSLDTEWDRRSHKPPDPAHVATAEGKQSLHDRTAITAMQRVVRIHQDPPPATSVPQTTSVFKDSQHDTKTRDNVPLHENGSTYDTLGESFVADSLSNVSIPPTIGLLLSRRQYRLAVFHLLNTPSYSSPALIQRIASDLELRGAGKLADRLRRSLDLPRRPHPEFPDQGKMQLAGRDKGQTFRSLSHWDIGSIPPAPLDTPRTSGETVLETRRRLSRHYNAHLKYLLSKRPVQPYGPLGPSVRPPGARWPAPSPRLTLLSKLLYSIDILEKRHGFEPDRVTANIIMETWLRCGLSTVKRSSTGQDGSEEGWYEFVNTAGDYKWGRKDAGPDALDRKRIMLMFRIVSTAMDRSVTAREKLFTPRGKSKATVSPSPTEDQRSGEGNVDRIEFRRHVLPFSEMVRRSLKLVDAREEQRAVLSWEKGLKARLEKVADQEVLAWLLGMDKWKKSEE